MVKKLDILVELGLLAKTYDNPIKCAAVDAANEIKSLRSWIKEEGLRSNTCTKNILGEICANCQCGKAV